jgi:hypothetical protein
VSPLIYLMHQNLQEPHQNPLELASTSKKGPPKRIILHYWLWRNKDSWSLVTWSVLLSYKVQSLYWELRNRSKINFSYEEPNSLDTLSFISPKIQNNKKYSSSNFLATWPITLLTWILCYYIWMKTKKSWHSITHSTICNRKRPVWMDLDKGRFKSYRKRSKTRTWAMPCLITWFSRHQSPTTELHGTGSNWYLVSALDHEKGITKIQWV